MRRLSREGVGAVAVLTRIVGLTGLSGNYELRF